jgi:hypothetical protein
MTGIIDKKEKKTYTFNRKEIVASKENPWVKDLATTIKKGKKITGFAANRHQLVDTATGEYHGDMAVVASQRVVDKEEFVKFFGAGIIEVFDLTKPGKDLFKTILHAYLDAQNAPDQIYINHAVLKDEYDYARSRATFSNAMAELLQKEFLAPIASRENLYWVNPHLFYKGNRIRIVNEFVRAGTEEEKQLMEEQKAMEQPSLALDNPNQEKSND